MVTVPIRVTTADLFGALGSSLRLISALAVYLLTKRRIRGGVRELRLIREEADWAADLLGLLERRCAPRRGGRTIGKKGARVRQRDPAGRNRGKSQQ